MGSNLESNVPFYSILYNNNAPKTRASGPQLRKFGKPMNERKFGFVMTSLSVRTQSHNANAPVVFWREVAWRYAFTTEVLKNTKYKINLFAFVGYVDKTWKE